MCRDLTRVTIRHFAAFLANLRRGVSLHHRSLLFRRSLPYMALPFSGIPTALAEPVCELTSTYSGYSLPRRRLDRRNVRYNLGGQVNRRVDLTVLNK